MQTLIPSVTVTAIGRALRPKNGEKRIQKIIAVSEDGTVKTVLKRELT